MSSPQRVYLDANILIYLVEGAPGQRRPVELLLQPLQAAGARFITSELSLAEVLVHPIRGSNDRLVSLYEQQIDEELSTEPISRQVLVLAARMRAETPSRRMPDAIHIATAVLTGAHTFVTGDKGIKSLAGAMQLLTV